MELITIYLILNREEVTHFKINVSTEKNIECEINITLHGLVRSR